MKLTRIRWGVRAVLALAVGASIAGNVLHAQGTLISQIISAWAPSAFLLTIELIARVPVHHRGLALLRWAATATIASIAAWVSYWHMAAVAARYGETGASPYLLPLSVDGLVVVASVCLVELGARIRAASVTVEGAATDPAAERKANRPTPDAAPATPQPAGKRQGGRPSSADRVAAAHRRRPDASNAEIAARLKVSEDTVRRHRPAGSAGKTPPDQPVNGRVPELAATVAAGKE